MLFIKMGVLLSWGISTYVYLHIFCVFVYIFGFSSYKIDRLMGGGRLRRPPLIKLSILYEENPKIYTKTHKKYANTQKHM